MTRLSLKSIDPRHDVSIRLLPGQFCTLGSSPAADYCVRAEGVQPMHCRIGCRQNGSFIECFDDNVSIVINEGEPKNRVRLSNDDRIKIGAVEIKVVIPQAVSANSLFEIAFDDHDTVTARDAPDESIEPLDSPIPRDIPEFHLTSAPADDTSIAAESESSAPIGSNDSFDMSAPKVVDSNPSEFDDLKSGDTSLGVPGESADGDRLEAPKPMAEPKPDDVGKPVFEFDSVDPSDINLTEEDLDVIENMSGHSLVLQDYDMMLDETFPDRGKKNTNEGTEAFAANLSAETPAAGNQISGGSDSGKCWRWTGKSALSALQSVQLALPALSCFLVAEHTRLIPTSYEAIKKAVSDRSGPQIFVVTEQHSNDLVRYFLTNRWNERLGHPQALSTFLTLLPAKHIESLFAQVDACVLVQDSDVELVRLTRELPAD